MHECIIFKNLPCPAGSPDPDPLVEDGIDPDRQNGQVEQDVDYKGDKAESFSDVQFAKV